MTKTVKNKQEKPRTEPERATASVRAESYRIGKIAAASAGASLTDFVSDAIDAFSKEVLKAQKVTVES